MRLCLAFWFLRKKQSNAKQLQGVRPAIESLNWLKKYSRDDGGCEKMKEVLKKFLFGLFVVLVLQGSKVRNAAALEKQANEQAYFEERFLIGDYEVTETEYEMRRPRTTHHPTTDDYSQEDGNNKRPWWYVYIYVLDSGFMF